MSYFIPFSNSLKTPIEVHDKITNTTTSLGIAGYKSISYGEVIAKNFIHLLENFANDVPPTNPIEGQLWYDTSVADKQLKIYNGTEWTPSSGVWKSTVSPTSPTVGDMWINTNTKKLYIYVSSTWVLIGSSDSSTNDTGLVLDQIIDTTNATQDILRYKINKKTIAIMARYSFIPKVFEEGFTRISSGINLSNTKTSGISNYTITGTIDNSKNLIITHPTHEEIVPSTKVIRSDTESVFDYKVVINNNEGLIVGGHSNLSLYVDGGHIYFRNTISGSHINLTLDDTNVLTIGNNNKVGINNEFPLHELDVNGKGFFNGGVIINDSSESISPNTGSLIVKGGLGVTKNVNLRKNLKVYEKSTLHEIWPLNPSSFIGTSTHKFSKIYSEEFHGTFYGSFAGSSTGSSSDPEKLKNETSFSIAGDIISPNILFDGKTGGLIKTFNTELNSNVITTKPTVTTLDDNDTFIIHSNYDDFYNPTSRLCKISKNDLIEDIINSKNIIPIGAINLFAGNVPPPKWLICDGSQVNIHDYNLLYGTIGNNYDPPGASSTTKFYLPSLTGPNGMLYIIHTGQ